MDPSLVETKHIGCFRALLITKGKEPKAFALARSSCLDSRRTGGGRDELRVMPWAARATLETGLHHKPRYAKAYGIIPCKTQGTGLHARDANDDKEKKDDNTHTVSLKHSL